VYRDHRALLDDSSIDAVLIATPPHLHCGQFVDALSAGKHVYQEKVMAFNVPDAKRMRAAFQRSAGRVVQIGHQGCSSGQMQDAREFMTLEPMGKISAIHMCMYRNTPHSKPQWARPLYPDMTPENVSWGQFLGEQSGVTFDAAKFVNWRLYQAFSGGNVYENMCQQLSFWYKALRLQIPVSANMTGDVYLWKDGREVPDTMTVALHQPEELLVTWNSGFGNDKLGVTEDVLGTDGTIQRGAQIRYAPQRVNVKDRQERLGRATAPPSAHMRNFIDSIRSGAEPNCPFEIGYRTSIACTMAVESYRQLRTVRWDAEKEEIV